MEGKGEWNTGGERGGKGAPCSPLSNLPNWYEGAWDSPGTPSLVTPEAPHPPGIMEGGFLRTYYVPGTISSVFC